MLLLGDALRSGVACRSVRLRPKATLVKDIERLLLAFVVEGLEVGKAYSRRLIRRAQPRWSATLSKENWRTSWGRGLDRKTRLTNFFEISDG